jgi:HAD superfamily hydrolase (TIGR01509 family)
MMRAIVFDVDGTLAETERDGHRVAFNAAFADEGLPWRWGEAEYLELLRVTGGKERMLHHWRRVDPAGAAAADAPATLARLHARKNAHYARLVRGGRIALREGVAELLDAARRRGLALAIATTTSAPNVRELLAHTLGEAAWGWFACIGAGDVVPAKKPAPDIYRWVLERLGLPARDCVAIEDSAAGAAAALGAGLPTVVTRSTTTRDDVLPAGCVELPDLAALGRGGPQMLDALAARVGLDVAAAAR